MSLFSVGDSDLSNIALQLWDLRGLDMKRCYLGTDQNELQQQIAEQLARINEIIAKYHLRAVKREEAGYDYCLVEQLFPEEEE